jgi:GNAT superfamily N-acetyltransferase
LADREFRRLAPDDEESGYGVLAATVGWLAEQGIGLWENPLPRDLYCARQQHGRNFGLFDGEALAVIVSLLPDLPAYWHERASAEPVMWLATLATHPEHMGRGLGAETVEAACRYAANEGVCWMYLDCKPGFLVGYYQKLSFEVVRCECVQTPYGTFETVLMRRRLGDV